MGTRDQKLIRLPAEESKPGKAEKIASKYERAYPGWKLVEFLPAAGLAVMGKMSDKQAVQRDVFAASLKAKPWEVHVTP